jgi:hypothetical protein
MQPAYTVKLNRIDRKTWMDHFVATEPKGGVRDVVQRMHNGDSSHRRGSATSGLTILVEQTVPYVVAV